MLVPWPSRRTERFSSDETDLLVREVEARHQTIYGYSNLRVYQVDYKGVVSTHVIVL